LQREACSHHCKTLNKKKIKRRVGGKKPLKIYNKICI